MKMNKLIAAIFFLGLGQIAFSQISIDGTNQTQTIDCKGDRVEVAGSGHDITLKGNCGKVVLQGVNNTVKVDGLLSVELAGSGNKLYYSKALSKNGKLPQSILGVDNKIIKRK